MKRPSTEFTEMCELTESSLRSHFLGNERRIWFQPAPADQPTQATVVLLDGEFYIERINAPEIIATLQSTRPTPSFSVVYVSHVDGPTRWVESFCNEAFAHFLDQELVPWAERQTAGFAIGRHVVLGGLSLTGLAAAHAALLLPERFPSVLCQSASFWWEKNRIVDIARERTHLPQLFRIVCGTDETAIDVVHGPELIQRISQIDSNQAMRDVLIEKKCRVSYEEYDGGHDFDCWKIDLPNSIEQALQVCGPSD